VGKLGKASKIWEKCPNRNIPNYYFQHKIKVITLLNILFFSHISKSHCVFRFHVFQLSSENLKYINLYKNKKLTYQIGNIENILSALFLDKPKS